MADTPTKLVRILLGALTRVEYTTVVRVPATIRDDQLDAVVDKFYDDTDGTEFYDDNEFWDKGECRHEPLAADDNTEPEFEIALDEEGDITTSRLKDSPKEYAKLAAGTWGVGDIQSLFQVTDEEAEQFILNNRRHFQDRMTELSWGVLETLGLMDGLKLTDPPSDENNDENDESTGHHEDRSEDSR